MEVDEYVRKLSSFLRNNERKLSESSIRRRDAAPARSLGHSFFPWFTSNQRIVLSLDTDKLHDLIIRFEGLGLNVGPTDVRPSRPFTQPLFNELRKDRSDTSSIASFRSSMSAISKLSLPVSALFYQKPNAEDEAKFVYSAFTRIPSISIHSRPSRIAFGGTETCIPLDPFKTLENLELVDTDPRRFLGWDRVAQTLRVLTMRRCALEDITVVLVDAVIEDVQRRDMPEFHRTNDMPESDELNVAHRSNSNSTHMALPRHAWSSLLSLSIPQTGLTFVQNLPDIPNLTHLDLSSNLLISIPQALNRLSSLIHLNLSDNMIESGLNANTCVGAVEYLNLSKNRLYSCAGLDRLLALRKVDLRDNQIEEADEISRLSAIPTIESIFAEGNPLEEDWRIRCFTRFYKEGLDILLDDACPSILERRFINVLPDASVEDKLLPSSEPVPTSILPTIASPKHPAAIDPIPSSAIRPKAKRKIKRIIDLNPEAIQDSSNLTGDFQNPLLSKDRQRSSSQVQDPSSSEGSRKDFESKHLRSSTQIGSVLRGENMLPRNVSQSKRSRRAFASMYENNLTESETTPPSDFRAQIEALREETGADWLRILAQRELVRPP